MAAQNKNKTASVKEMGFISANNKELVEAASHLTKAIMAYHRKKHNSTRLGRKVSS